MPLRLKIRGFGGREKRDQVFGFGFVEFEVHIEGPSGNVLNSYLNI